MAKAAAQATSAREEFEDAISALPHVRSNLPPERWKYPRNWWCLDIRVGSPDDEQHEKWLSNA